MTTFLEILLPLLLTLQAPQIVTPQSAEKIIERAEELLRGESSTGTFEMTVVTPEFTRSLTMDSWWVGTEKSLITIKLPKKEAGNKWLKIGNEMWNYLRATETTIKIPPSMMLQSWNGSDFSNDDLARESSLSKDYSPILIGMEKLEDDECWKLALIPKPQAPVVWGKLYIWVRTLDLAPRVVEYYDEKGTLIRYMVYSDIKKMGGRTIPTVWTMFNKLKPGNKTEFKIIDIAFNTRIPDRVFSFRELERGN